MNKIDVRAQGAMQLVAALGVLLSPFLVLFLGIAATAGDDAYLVPEVIGALAGAALMPLGLKRMRGAQEPLRSQLDLWIVLCLGVGVGVLLVISAIGVGNSR